MDPRVQAAGREPIIIQGHPGFYGKANVASLGGVSWPYSEDAWAEVVCLDDSGLVDKELSISIAENIVFAPTVTRLPFKLSEVPSGYEVQSVAPGLPSGDDDVLAGLGVGIAAQPQNMVQISLHSGVTEIPPGLPGWERDTINGLPAVLSAYDGTLFLNVRGVESGRVVYGAWWACR